MRKLLSLCVIMALFLMVGCATLQNWIGQPQLQTYTFIFDGGEYSALLPNDVPLPLENAEQIGRCPHHWSGLCVIHVLYAAGVQPRPDYPNASFWFTKELGIVALVWHTLNNDGTKKHTPYIYIKGLPVKVSSEEIQAKLDELTGKQ